MKIDKSFARGFEDYLKFAILMGFSFLMFKLIFDGNIGYYINPKLIPLVIVCAIFLILIAFVLFVKTRTLKNHKSKLSYFLFIIPILMGLFVPAKTISGAELQLSTGQNKSASSVSGYNRDAGSKIKIKSEENDSQNNSETKQNKLVFDDMNFALMIDTLYAGMNQYKDTDVEIMGKVYKDSSMKSNEFAIVRPLMSCCSADTALVGLLCINNMEIKVNKDTWAKIEGKVSISNGKSGKMPSIEVQNVTVVDKPKNEFVYPY